VRLFTWRVVKVSGKSAGGAAAPLAMPADWSP
jgi:hypothetical protein